MCVSITGDRRALIYAQQLDEQPRATLLTLPSCRLSDKGIFNVTVHVAKHSNLVEINLAQNFIADCGAICLSYALSSCQNLKTLHLQENKIENTGAIAIANAVDGVLFFVFMSSNSIAMCRAACVLCFYEL